MRTAASFTMGEAVGPVSEELRKEIEAAQDNGCVGSVLVSETDEVRVWHLTVKAGTRCGFHKHVLNYFWTCHDNGSARNIFENGSTRDDVYYAGETRHLKFGPGEYMLHALENTGTTDLTFTTVEFIKGSANSPLPVPQGVRLQVPKAA